ncbi:unnamed protein product, partial [Sphenostylis stenocarpa]
RQRGHRRVAIKGDEEDKEVTSFDNYGGGKRVLVVLGLKRRRKISEDEFSRRRKKRFRYV